MSDRFRILLVEDNPGDAKLVGELLSRDGPVGFEVECASRLATAVERLTQGHFDGLLLDLGLPDSTGLDTVRAMRQAAADLPLVVLTGDNDEQTGIAAIKEGAQDYVVKGTASVASLSRILRYAVEREQSARRLRESQEREREILEYGGIGVTYWDLEGCVLLLNRRAAQNLGGSDPEEFLGKPLTEVFGPEAGSVYLEHIREAAASPESHEYEDSLDTPMGQRWYSSVFTRSVNAAGNVVGVHAYSNDITEHKQMEESLRLTQLSVDRAGDLIHWIDSEGRLLYVSDSTCRRHGYSREELLGMTIFDLDPLQSPRIWRKHWRDLKKRGSLTFETVHRTKDGEVFPVEVTANFVEHEGKKYNFGFGRDISERKKAEETLRESEEQLRQSQKMEAVGQLAGGIAHDFNNLLTAIIGNSSLALASMAPEDPNRPLLDDIQEVGERAAGLVRQILAFSRRQMLKPEILCLNTVVLDLEPLLRRTLGEDIQLQFLLAPDLKGSEIDPQQIGQVLLNLAVNARDAMPDGGRLVIETVNATFDRAYCQKHRETTAGDYVMLTVSDTGSGMDKETLAHLFEPFFTTKEVGKGTGLGLSTVFGIVKQSGGSISVDSEPGEGSTFKVCLPVAEASEASVAEPVCGQDEPRRGYERILVVEDEASVRDLLIRILSRSGYQVRAAGSAREIEKVLDSFEHHPDLLVTDVVLPGGTNGQQVAETLRKRFPRLCVLFMSGYTNNAVVHDGRLDEGVAFLEKPFAPETLLRMVRGALDERGGAPGGQDQTSDSGGA